MSSLTYQGTSFAGCNACRSVNCARVRRRRFGGFIFQLEHCDDQLLSTARRQQRQQILQEGFHSGDGYRHSRSGRRAARRRAHVPGARHLSDRADKASGRTDPERPGQSSWRLKDNGNRPVDHNSDQYGHADKLQVARPRAERPLLLLAWAINFGQVFAFGTFSISSPMR